MLHRISAVLACFSLVAATGLSSLAAAPEEKLPASANLVLLLDKPSEAAEKWQKTALGSMFAGQDFAPFYAELQKAEIAAPLNPRPALGLDWADIAKFKEPVALAILEGEGKKPAIVFLAGGKEDAAEVKRVMVDAEKYFDGRKAKRVVKKVAGGELVTYEIAAFAGNEAGVCIHLTSGNLLAITNSSAAADQLLKQWEAGEKTSLAADSDFKKIDAQSRKLVGEKSADVRWFVRPLALTQLLQKKPDPKERGIKDLAAIAKKLGLQAITSIGGVVTLQPDKNHDLEVASLVIAKRPFEKGMRLLDLKPGKPIPPAAWVEADIGSYMSWNWDFSMALDGAGNWLDAKLDEKGLFEDILGRLKKDKEVDVKKDIVARLGPGIFEIGDAHRAKDPSNPTGLRRIIGIKAKEQANLAKALKLVTRDEGEVIKDEVVAGNPVRSAPNGEPLFTDPDADVPFNTKVVQAYAVTPTLSLLSTDVVWLRSKLTAKEKVKPLVEDPAYKQLAIWTAKLENDKTCLRGFLRSDQSGRLDYEAVRAGGVNAKSSSQAKLLKYVLLGHSAAKAPAAALPKFDTLAPNLLPTGISMAVSPDGFEVRGAVLRKE